MKFYYCNLMGDSGVFYEKDLIKAIYTAWNINADLFIMPNDLKKKDMEDFYGYGKAKLVFCPLSSNEFNSDLLKEFGYYMEDGEKYREIKEIKTGKIIKYDWSEVKDLI